MSRLLLKGATVEEVDPATLPAPVGSLVVVGLIAKGVGAALTPERNGLGAVNQAVHEELKGLAVWLSKGSGVVQAPNGFVVSGVLIFLCSLKKKKIRMQMRCFLVRNPADRAQLWCAEKQGKHLKCPTPYLKIKVKYFVHASFVLA